MTPAETVAGRTCPAAVEAAASGQLAGRRQSPFLALASAAGLTVVRAAVEVVLPAACSFLAVSSGQQFELFPPQLPLSSFLLSPSVAAVDAPSWTLDHLHYGWWREVMKYWRVEPDLASSTPEQCYTSLYQCHGIE